MSTPGNSPPWAYADTMSITVDNEKDPCKSMREEVKDKCGKHLEDNTYSTGRINQSGLKREMCKDKECKKATKCVLVPYKFGCCDGKTPHHVIPAHCFMPPGERSAGTGARYSGCDKYAPDQAPCICVSGKDKSNKRKQHARIHKHFDAMEDAQKPLWDYSQAATAGAQSAKKVMKCDEKCTQAQLDKYHKQDSEIPASAKLRADSSGQGVPSPQLTIVTPTGAVS